MAQFLPSQIFANIPEFNGTGSCSEWVDNFNARCAHFRYDDLWKLNNMHRFMLETAKHWWQFSKARFTEGLTRVNAQAKFTEFVAAIKLDFPEADDRKLAMKENNSLKFDPHSDKPIDYVFKKRAIFVRIDPNMNQATQLDYLYEGLSKELRWAVKRQLGANGTVQQFLAELKSLAEEYVKQDDKPNSSENAKCSDLYKFNASKNSVSQPVITDAIVPQDAQSQTQQFLSSLPASLLEPPVLLCGYCGQRGHLIMGCELHSKHFMPRQENRYEKSYGKDQNNSSYRPHNNNKFYDRDNNNNKGDYRKYNKSQDQNKQGNGKA